MIFHLDEQMPDQIIEAAALQGLSATSVNRLGLKGLDDSSNLLMAAETGRVLVTYDHDYLLLHEAWLNWSRAWDLRTTPRHGGIAVIYSAKGVPPNAIADALAQLRRLFPSIANRAFTWDIQAGWVEVQ